MMSTSPISICFKVLMTSKGRVAVLAILPATAPLTKLAPMLSGPRPRRSPSNSGQYSAEKGTSRSRVAV